MAELTKEEALHTWSTLRELLETGDYDTLDPDEEYADEEEVEGELAACLLHLKKACVCFILDASGRVGDIITKTHTDDEEQRYGSHGFRYPFPRARLSSCSCRL